MSVTAEDEFARALAVDTARKDTGTPHESTGEPIDYGAPYGYKANGEPRKNPPGPGRPRKSPPLDDLKDRASETAGEAAPSDRIPEEPKGRRSRHARQRQAASEPLPPFKEGQIARGINRLYRKAGRIIRAMDRDIGMAVIESTQKIEEDDVTVGEAWEEIARHNPRIRRFLLRIMKGGAWGQLFWAHAPIFLAIFMKDSIRSRIPAAGLAEAFLGQDEDGESPADGTPLEGLGPQDMQQMMQVAQQFAEQMASGRGFAAPRAPESPDRAGGRE